MDAQAQVDIERAVTLGLDFALIESGIKQLKQIH
jgi:hypothetical protein